MERNTLPPLGVRACPSVGYLGYYRVDIRSNDLRAAVTVKPAAA